MTSLVKDESGVAFGIVVLAALLLVGTVVLLGMSSAMNSIIDVFNGQVDAGQVSTQRADAMAWGIMVFNSAYIWLLLGGLAWAVVRALEYREGV